MARVLISATIRDAKTLATARVRNKQVSSEFINDTAMTLADITAHHDEFIQKLDDVTDGVIESSSITIYPALPAGLKASPVAGSDVQEGASLSFAVTGSNYSEAFRVPAIKSTLLGADGQSVPNAGDMATFITFLTGGGTSAHPAVDKAGVDIAAFIAGKKSFRK